MLYGHTRSYPKVKRKSGHFQPLKLTQTDSIEPLLGSYEASGLDGSVVFDRTGRFTAYGLDEFDTWTMEDKEDSNEFSWDDVAWGDLQDACVDANAQRFKHVDERPDSSIQYSNIKHKHPNRAGKTGSTTKPSVEASKVKRTAILIRVWTGVDWTADAVMNIRALIAEASLTSGGKYQVFILLHVKDEQVPLFVGEDEPEKTIAKNVPPEFRSITEVWNHAQIRGLYSNIAEHAFVGRSPWMIVQWFARNHPEFDFFYQWEYDVRYTGHYLDFLEAVSDFGKQQPRKGIWERAGRHYIPSLHGAYDKEYRDYVRNIDPHRIWGPVAVEGVKPRGPKPPVKQDKDEYQWGVGEEADWIGFLPSFNVTGTEWFFKDNIWGYDQKLSTPRRATLVAQGRVSRRVLDIMNYENAENGHHMDAEMFPQSMALHHGLKSTTFPHPIFADRHWPGEGANDVFNPGPYHQAGGVKESVFSKWNEWVWTNMTWYYNAGQAKPVFQHLLGISALDVGGSEWETERGKAVARPMLLHPVKGAKAMKWTPTGWIATKGGK